MKKGIIIGCVIFVILILFGCFFLLKNKDSSNNGEEISKNNQILKSATYSGDISEIILNLNELPEGYQVAERSPRTLSSVSEKALNRGWNEGYYIRYTKGESLFDFSRIEIFTSRYPLENISKTLEEGYSKLEGYYAEPITPPKIGDNSLATKYTEEELGFKEYTIEFYKKDIYVRIDMGGSITDYELLKELVKKVEKKI